MNQRQLKQIIRLVVPLFTLLKQYPKQVAAGLIAALLLGTAWHQYETKVMYPKMNFMGVPEVSVSPGWRHILRNDGFILEYDEVRHNPLWVAYKVTQDKVKYGKRPAFSSDWRSPFGVKHEHYTGTKYDRGHMAPNYVIASRYGRNAQLDTFLMTNITPQKPKLNQKTWQRLEEVSADHFSKLYPEFWVYTGPIFDQDPNKIKWLANDLSKQKVAIPKAFFKLFIRQDPSGDIHSLAMVLPQNAHPRSKLTKFVTSIDKVEAMTGIDFFHELDDAIENAIEKHNDHKAWRLKEVANRPSSY